MAGTSPGMTFLVISAIADCYCWAGVEVFGGRYSRIATLEEGVQYDGGSSADGLANVVERTGVGDRARRG